MVLKPNLMRQTVLGRGNQVIWLQEVAERVVVVVEYVPTDVFAGVEAFVEFVHLLIFELFQVSLHHRSHLLHFEWMHPQVNIL